MPISCYECFVIEFYDGRNQDIELADHFAMIVKSFVDLRGLAMKTVALSSGRMPRLPTAHGQVAISNAFIHQALRLVRRTIYWLKPSPMLEPSFCHECRLHEL